MDTETDRTVASHGAHTVAATTRARDERFDAFLLVVRRALLLIVRWIEKDCGIKP